MAVMIGNARISEYGTVNGAAGDQTGKEVMEQTWTSGGKWQYVIRPKDADKARKIAAAMNAACANDNIGYSQADRTSLYNLAARNGYELNKVGKCNTDCSALVAVCVNAAGIKVSQNMYTGNELTVLGNTGEFTIYSSAEYTQKSDKLRTGDILLRSGHTAIVTQGAVEFPEEETEDEVTTGGTAQMQLTYTVDNGSTVYWFDGQQIHKLSHPDQLKILREIYKLNNGKDMPHKNFSSKAPYHARLAQAIKAGAK